ncbi:MAG: hypothetical protein K0S65_6327, partial [Labilithrix sp.]|nr:hypothetical protein [Labilithrix sp.]
MMLARELVLGVALVSSVVAWEAPSFADETTADAGAAARERLEGAKLDAL